MKKKAIIIIVIIAIAVVAGILLGKKFGGSSKGGDAAYVESVSELMGGADSGAQNRYAGVVESQETWDVNVSADQKIKEVLVSVGDEVQEGTPLFTYDVTDLGLQLSQAKLDLESIDNEITGYKNQISALKKEKETVSKSEQFSYTVQIQSLETSIKQAEYNKQSKNMEIEKMQAGIDQSTVLCKITGVVKEVNEVGATDEYGQSKPFISVLTTGDFRIKGMVNEQNVYQIEEGMPVLLRSRVDDTIVWTGTVDTVDLEAPEGNQNDGMMMMSDSSSETQSSKYPFYVQIDNSEGLMLGQHVYIELDAGMAETEGIWLYSSYIVQEPVDVTSSEGSLSAEQEMAAYVWAVNENGKLEKRTVELGEYNEMTDQYHILSGLLEEDYIAWPQEELYEGMNTTTNMEESFLMNGAEEGLSIDEGEMYYEEGMDMGEGYDVEGAPMDDMMDGDMPVEAIPEEIPSDMEVPQ